MVPLTESLICVRGFAAVVVRITPLCQLCAVWDVGLPARRHRRGAPQSVAEESVARGHGGACDLPTHPSRCHGRRWWYERRTGAVCSARAYRGVLSCTLGEIEDTTAVTPPPSTPRGAPVPTSAAPTTTAATTTATSTTPTPTSGRTVPPPGPSPPPRPLPSTTPTTAAAFTASPIAAPVQVLSGERTSLAALKGWPATGVQHLMSRFAHLLQVTPATPLTEAPVSVAPGAQTEELLEACLGALPEPLKTVRAPLFLD